MLLAKLTILSLAKKYNIDPTDVVHQTMTLVPAIKKPELKRFLKLEKVSLQNLQSIHMFNKIAGAPQSDLINLNMYETMKSAGHLLTKNDIAKAIIIFSERAKAERDELMRERYLKFAQLFRELYTIVKKLEYGELSIEEADKEVEKILKKFEELRDPVLRMCFTSKAKAKVGDIEIEV